VAGLMALSISPAATTVSAAATTPVDSYIYIGSVQLLGVKSTSGDNVTFTQPNFAQSYTIKNDQTCTGIQIYISMKSYLEDPQDYQCSVKIKTPSNQVALNIARDSSGWSYVNVIDDVYIIQHSADLTFTQAGTWTIEVDLWYFT
jgi:hypothetical protein